MGCYIHAFSESVGILMIEERYWEDLGVMGGSEVLRKECCGPLIETELSSTSD